MLPSYMPKYCAECCNCTPQRDHHGRPAAPCSVFRHTRGEGPTRRNEFTAIMGDDGMCRAFNVEWHICPYNWCRRVVFPEDVRRGKQGAERCVNCVGKSVEELRASKE